MQKSADAIVPWPHRGRAEHWKVDPNWELSCEQKQQTSPKRKAKGNQGEGRFGKLRITEGAEFTGCDKEKGSYDVNLDVA
jgi:hypothetical protein